jgi:hypothetical protein
MQFFRTHREKYELKKRKQKAKAGIGKRYVIMKSISDAINKCSIFAM